MIIYTSCSRPGAPSSSAFIYSYRLFSSSRFSAVSRAKPAVKIPYKLKQNRMAVLRNHKRPRMHPRCKDPLLKKKKSRTRCGCVGTARMYPMEKMTRKPRNIGRACASQVYIHKMNK